MKKLIQWTRRTAALLCNGAATAIWWIAGGPKLEDTIDRINKFNAKVDSVQPRDIVALATYIESLIDKEWKLAGDRAKILISIQVFLFTAMLFTLINIDKNPKIADELLEYYPLGGLVTVGAGAIGIFTAVIVARRLEHYRSFCLGLLAKTIQIQIPDLGSARGKIWNPLNTDPKSVELLKDPDNMNRTGWIVKWSRPFGTAPFLFTILLLLVSWTYILNRIGVLKKGAAADSAIELKLRIPTMK